MSEMDWRGRIAGVRTINRPAVKEDIMRPHLSIGMGVLVLSMACAAYGGRWEILPPVFPGYQTEGVAVSADGSVVVGSTGTPTGQRAFRWTEATGMVTLPVPAGVTMTWATDVSNDGNWISGYGGSSFGTRSGWKGFRFQVGGALDVIEVEGKGVWAKGISGDGQRIAGTVQGVAARDPSEAFTWTLSGGLASLSNPLYAPPGPSNANAISADGGVVAGDTGSADGMQRSGFRWTGPAGMSAVGNFTASAASRDGSTVVGTIATDHGFAAFRWTEPQGVVELPHPGFGSNYTSAALGVSGDGSRVVGYIEDQSTDLRQAFIWDQTHGYVLLQDLLENVYGYDLTGWSLTKAYAISDDGNTVVGRGLSPQMTQEAFRVYLTPEPSTLSLVLVSGATGLLRRRRGNGPQKSR